MVGSPTMQSSAVRLVSSNPSTVGVKSFCRPKFTGGAGVTSSRQGNRSRPMAASGTSTRGCKVSFDSMISVACDRPVAVGVNDTIRLTLAPGAPTVLAPPWTDQVPSFRSR